MIPNGIGERGKGAEDWDMVNGEPRTGEWGTGLVRSGVAGNEWPDAQTSFPELPVFYYVHFKLTSNHDKALVLLYRCLELFGDATLRETL